MSTKGNCEACEQIQEVDWFTPAPDLALEALWDSRFKGAPVLLCMSCAELWEATPVAAGQWRKAPQ